MRVVTSFISILDSRGNDMKLSELVGRHKLDAVDFETQELKTYDDEFQQCNVIRFRLDGKCYVALENPEDGYRSSMDELIESPSAIMKNTFMPIKVVSVHRKNSKLNDYGKDDDILELISIETGDVILQVGTDNQDEWYPTFVSYFSAEALTKAINASSN